MVGAREYAQLFRHTVQIGRLYLVVGRHARGYEFRIYVLPEGEKAIPNGPHNPPLNRDAVCVYGITGGQPGWTETYGWLHRGPWEEDFARAVAEHHAEMAIQRQESEHAVKRYQENEAEREKRLLASYGVGRGAN